MSDDFRRWLFLWLLRRRMFRIPRPEIFRWIAHVVGALAGDLAFHEYDDVDAAEQRAIAHLGRVLSNARDVAIETAELFEALDGKR